MGFDTPNAEESADKWQETPGKIENITKAIGQDLTEFRDWCRYKVRNDLDAANRMVNRYSQETTTDTDHAETVTQLAEQTWNPELITAYLQNKEAGSLDGNSQSQMLKLGDNAYFANYSPYAPRSIGDQETVVDFYTQLADKGGSPNDNWKIRQYTSELMAGKWGNAAPEYLALLSQEQQEEAYELNPKGFAKTFPADPLVKGDTLAELVKTEVDWLKNQSLDRSVSVGQIGRGPTRTLLANPNLSPEQRKAICTAISSIDIENRNSDSCKAMDLIVRNVAANRTNINDLAAVVNKFYGPNFKRGYISEPTYAAIVQRAETAKTNKKIDNESYNMLIATKRFLPGQNAPKAPAVV